MHRASGKRERHLLRRINRKLRLQHMEALRSHADSKRSGNDSPSGSPRAGAEVIKGNKMVATAKTAGLEPVTWQLTSHTLKSRSIQLFPTLYKGRMRKSPRMRLQQRSGRSWVANENEQYFFPSTAACQAMREAHPGNSVGEQSPS